MAMKVLVAVLLMIIVLSTFLFLGGEVFWPAGKTTLSNAAKTNGCNRLVTIQCSDPTSIWYNDFDADQDGGSDPGPGIGDCKGSKSSSAKDNLVMLFKCYFGTTGNTDSDLKNSVKSSCGCLPS